MNHNKKLQQTKNQHFTSHFTQHLNPNMQDFSFCFSFGFFSKCVLLRGVYVYYWTCEKNCQTSRHYFLVYRWLNYKLQFYFFWRLDIYCLFVLNLCFVVVGWSEYFYWSFKNWTLKFIFGLFLWTPRLPYIRVHVCLI